MQKVLLGLRHATTSPTEPTEESITGTAPRSQKKKAAEAPLNLSRLRGKYGRVRFTGFTPLPSKKNCRMPRRAKKHTGFFPRCQVGHDSGAWAIQGPPVWQHIDGLLLNNLPSRRKNQIVTYNPRLQTLCSR